MAGPLSLANQISLRAIKQAVRGLVRVTASQNRHADEDSPSWALRIEGENHGIEVAIENDGPTLSPLINDAIGVLERLGIDVKSEIDTITDATPPQPFDS